MQALTLRVPRKMQHPPNFLIPTFASQVIFKSIKCIDQGCTDLMI